MDAYKQTNPITSNLAIIFLSGLFALASAFLASGLMIVNAEGFTTRDFQREFVVFTSLSLPLALGVSLFAPLTVRVFSRMPIVLDYGLSLCLGATLGYLWAYIPLLCLYNPFFGTGMFSFPVYYAWMVEVASGLLVIAGLSHGKRLWVPGGISVLLCLVFGILGMRIFYGMTGQRQINLKFIVWYPGQPPLSVDSHTEQYLTGEELELLRQADLGGHTEWQGGPIRGPDNVPSSTVIVLMYQQIEAVEWLEIPKRGSVIYIQREDGWQVLPPNTIMVGEDFRLRLVPEKDFTMWWIDTTGGDAFQWYR